MRIRHIATRFALILAAAALLPLAGYGTWSVLTLQRGTRETVVTGNLNVATRAAEEIRRYIAGNANILKALAADLQDTGLAVWQQDRIVKNYVLQFREFRELTLFDAEGTPVATSRVGAPRVTVPDAPIAEFEGVSMSRIEVDDDLLPTTTFALRLQRLGQPAGWLVGELSLEEMWRMVDRVRIGAHGFALVIAPDGQLVAHGDPDRKALVAQGQSMRGHALFAPTPTDRFWREYDDERGVRHLGVTTRIEGLGWTVAVEQPTSEAYASAARQQQQLAFAAFAALVLMTVAGLVLGRRFIAPIFALRRGTEALAGGHLDARVRIDSADEFGQLGASFNAMADRLLELQEDVKRKERQAMFGRVVAGLFHDINHPIQNIGNNARLLLRPDLDDDARAASRLTIERELATLKRFMDDVLNVSRPRPLERFQVDMNGAVADVVEAMRAEGERANVTVSGEYAPGPVLVEGDRFALGRVYRNLITNAIQATPPGGRVTVTTVAAGDHVEVRVTDTGVGIPADRLAAIFDDFVTTKRRGLGLGLAICKRIVEQLGGTIGVTSEPGRGTTFTVRFPRSAAGAVEAAS
jgi:signal transduction histidine kinase